MLTLAGYVTVTKEIVIARVTIYFTNFLYVTNAMLMSSEREEKRGSRCALEYNVMSCSGRA